MNAYIIYPAPQYFYKLAYFQTSTAPLISTVLSANDFLWLYKRHTPDVYLVVYLMSKFGSTGVFYGDDMNVSSGWCNFPL